MTRKQLGFTLVEVILAIVVGLVVMAGGFAAFHQFNETAKINRAKAIVATVQSSIQQFKYRTGTLPDTQVNIGLNKDDRGEPFYKSTGTLTNLVPLGMPDGHFSETNLPPDPIHGKTALYYSDDATPSVVTDTDGKSLGGWLYLYATGQFYLNVSDEDIPDDPPSKW